jgi:hypothetical protein
MEPARLHRLRIPVNPPLTAGNNSRAASTFADALRIGQRNGMKPVDPLDANQISYVGRCGWAWPDSW